MSNNLAWPDGQKEWLVATLGPEQAAQFIEAAEQQERILKWKIQFWRNAPEPPGPPWVTVLPIEHTVVLTIVHKFLEQFPGHAREIQLVEKDEGYRRFAVTTVGFIHLSVAPDQQTQIRATAADSSSMMQPDDKETLGLTLSNITDFILHDFHTMQQQAAQAQVTLAQMQPQEAGAKEAIEEQPYQPLTPDKVIETYYRRKNNPANRNKKITLKQICAELGVNYASIRVAKVSYDKRKRRRNSD